MTNQEPIYVVATHNDGRDDYTGDAYAIKFNGKQEAEKFLHTEPAPYDSRVREMMNEDQFLATWTKPAEEFTEGVANDLGYVWDNDYKCWCGIGVYSIDDYQNNKEWFDSEVDIEAVDVAGF